METPDVKDHRRPDPTPQERERMFGEIKYLFKRLVNQANCREDNDALNKLANFVINTSWPDGNNPVAQAKEFVKMIQAPSHDVGTLIARRIFFERATGGQFSGG